MERKDILKKLKAFSERTIENGCTEAEALAAAKAMQGLQNKYDLTLTELDIELTEYVQDKFSLGSRVKHPVIGASFGIKLFCGVKFYTSGANLVIYGQQHKVDSALYLISLIQSAMELEFNRYKFTPDYCEQKWSYHPRTIRSSFMNGMAQRVGQRLQRMHKENADTVEQPKASNGTALVVMADRALEDAFRKAHPNLVSGNRRVSGRSRGAVAAGRSAANRVGLNKGVGGGRSMGLLT